MSELTVFLADCPVRTTLAARAMLDLALGHVDPGHHGRLVQFGREIPWR